MTDAVLHTLEQRGLVATFFVVGRRLTSPEGRALAEQTHAAGHWVGNHTMTHTVPLGALPDPDAVDAEIDDAQRLLGALAHPDLLFRPYGAGGVIDRNLLGRRGRQRLLDGGFTCVLWNCVPRDWVDPDGWVATCAAMVAAQPWSVVVVHDLPTGAMAHLERFIDELDRVDVEWRQDLPDACTPIRRGVPTESFALIDV